MHVENGIDNGRVGFETFGSDEESHESGFANKEFHLKNVVFDVAFRKIGSLSNYDDDHNDDFKNNRFNDQNNSSSRVSRFLVHFFDVSCTTTTWNFLICRFMEDVDIRRRIFLPLFEPEWNP